MPAAPKNKPKTKKPRKSAVKAAPQPEEFRATGYRGYAIAAWALILITCGLAMVPVLGFASWLIATPVLIAALVLAIFVIHRGGVRHGVVLLVFAVLIAPLTVLFAPTISSATGLYVLSKWTGGGADHSGAASTPKAKSAANAKVHRASNPVAQKSKKTEPVRQHAILD